MLDDHFNENSFCDGRITIRPVHIDDLQGIYEATRESIIEVTPWMSWCHPDYTVEECGQWIESSAVKWASGVEYNFTIMDKTKNDLILGCCGLRRKDPDENSAFLGCWVRSSRTNEGIATSASRLIIRFGFNELRLKRIQITSATGNKASLRAIEKLGATQKGILRSGCVVRGRVYDSYLFSLLMKYWYLPDHR